MCRLYQYKFRKILFPEFWLFWPVVWKFTLVKNQIPCTIRSETSRTGYFIFMHSLFQNRKHASIRVSQFVQTVSTRRCNSCDMTFSWIAFGNSHQNPADHSVWRRSALYTDSQKPALQSQLMCLWPHWFVGSSIFEGRTRICRFVPRDSLTVKY